MTRGTTPVLEFVLPFDTALISEIWVTLAQDGAEVLTKTLTDCERRDKTLSVRLKQEETLLLRSGCSTEVQVRLKTEAGEALASRVMTVGTDRILKEGVI